MILKAFVHLRALHHLGLFSVGSVFDF
jgi:hypothetical protein